MNRFANFLLATLLFLTTSGFPESSLQAQSAQPAGAAQPGEEDAPDPSKLIDGFEVRLEATATGKELERQENLWVMEVTFKSMRMRRISITDPKTKIKKPEVIWYLVYKAVVRPIARRADTDNTVPQNTEDAVPSSLFVPEFILRTTDSDSQKIYHDVIIPEAQADILKNREKRYTRQPYLKNTVEAVGPIPDPTPLNSKTENAIYGIVMWRGVDPETDYFEVYMTGFSNGYRKENGLVLRKTIVQKYKRPGDRFFQTEAEIKRDGEPKWIYWPDDKNPGNGTPAGKN
ncbi:MAG: hypothetical protein Tsb009_33570 [Planctomycetaceae bacterium]